MVSAGPAFTEMACTLSPVGVAGGGAGGASDAVLLPPLPRPPQATITIAKPTVSTERRTFLTMTPLLNFFDGNLRRHEAWHIGAAKISAHMTVRFNHQIVLL